MSKDKNEHTLELRLDRLEHRVSAIEAALRRLTIGDPALVDKFTEQANEPANTGRANTEPTNTVSTSTEPASIVSGLNQASTATKTTAVSPPAGQLREAELATRWLNRVGIVVLVAGVASLLALALPALPAIGKLALGTGFTVLLVGSGSYLMRRYRIFGQVLLGGGLALAYFVAYACYFVDSLRLFESPYPSLTLMTLMVATILGVAQRLRSESVAGMAFLLGYATAVVSQMTALTLASLLLLALASIVLLVRNRWVIVPVSSLAFVYATHALWATGVLGYGGQAGRFVSNIGALTLYFVVFCSAPFLLRALEAEAQKLAPIRSLLAGLNTGCFSLLAFAAVFEHHRSVCGYLLGGFVALYAGLALVASRLSRIFKPLAKIYSMAALIAAASALFWFVPPSWVGLSWGILGLVAFFVPRLQAIGGVTLLFGCVGQLIFSLSAPWAALSAATLLLASERLLPRFREVEGVTRAQITTVMVCLSALLFLCGSFELSGGIFTTFWWIAIALAFFGGGLAFASRLHRLCGLAVLATTLVKVVLYDMTESSALVRLSAVVILGLVLLGVSFLYTRLEQYLRRGDCPK